MTTDTLSEWPSSRDAQEAKKSVSPKHWFRQLIRKTWLTYSQVIIISLFINVLALATPLFIRQVYDQIIPLKAIDTLGLLVIAVLSALAFEFVLRNLRAFCIDKVGKKIDIQVSSELFSRLLGVKLADRPASVGSLANSIQTFDGFREFMTSATLSTLVDLPFVIVFLGLIALLSGNLVWVPLVAMPLIVSLSLFIQRPHSRLIQEAFKHSAKKQAFLIESLASLETIKALGAESPFQQRYEGLSRESASMTNKTKWLSSLANHFALFAQTLASIALVVYGVYEISAGNLSVGALIACSLLSARALSPIAQIAVLISRYQHAKAGFLAVDELMKLAQEKSDQRDLICPHHFQGHIEFSGVSFQYPGAKLSALNAISLKIQAGERVAIIGKTGSGKSTLAKTIMKFYEPTRGHVFIDGVDLRQLDPCALRRYIGYIPQEVVLFKGSIKDNILLGSSNVDESALLRAVQLGGVNSFLENHPEGLDRMIGERGEGLSGGQRQAIAIARALLLDPPLLLFDEPSNGFDENSTEALIERLTPILSNKTFILVTHKTAMLKCVDRVIVMDNSQIVTDMEKS